MISAHRPAYIKALKAFSHTLLATVDVHVFYIKL